MYWLFIVVRNKSIIWFNIEILLFQCLFYSCCFDMREGIEKPDWPKKVVVFLIDSRTSLRIVWSNFKCQIDNCATCWRAVNTAACRDVDLSPILKYFSVRYWPVRAIRQLPASGDARKTSINSESFLRISLLNFESGVKCIKWNWNTFWVNFLSDLSRFWIMIYF